ncbi:Putative tricarboxylic transport TctC [Hyphomicrobiales bacterium]|nr:putative tricarboxylic transport TctC [Hyphomicrobiales bacterium]CAH1677042.1 Putative tricarboxylic transport TctC [Hyphomicrobiales bacterium]
MAWTRRPIDLQSAYTIVSRRACLTFAAVAALGLCVQAPAHAQTMTAPEGSIEITVGSGPGATPDVIMRRVAKILNEDKIVTNPIVVQNRTGGGWTVAANYVLGHPGNKNILFGVVPTVYATPIVQGLPNTYEKVTPLAMLARIDLLVVVRADSPYKTLADFVKAAKEKERALSMAGANVGSTDHIVNALIEKAGGVKLNYVPFDGGGGQVISSLLGGVVTAITLPPDEAMPLLQGGKARAIAVLSEQRLTEPSLKDIPTAREQGVDVIWGQYYGIAGPPQLDPSVVAWWQDKFTKMVATPAWAAMMKDMYLTSAYVPANEARPAMDKVYQGFASVLSDLGLAKK